MHRPYVIINCAMSVDGKIALPSRIQTKISTIEDLRRVHRLRNECDAILVGINTIISDDPKLTVKSMFVKNSKNPIRIVLDSKGRIPWDAKVLDGQAQTIIVVSEKCNRRRVEGGEIIRCGKEKIDLKKLLHILWDEKGVKKLLVEGGETVIWSFLKSGLADELQVYIGSMIIGGTKSPTLAGGEGVKRFEDIIKLKLENVEKLGNGVLLKYKIK